MTWWWWEGVGDHHLWRRHCISYSLENRHGELFLPLERKAGRLFYLYLGHLLFDSSMGLGGILHLPAACCILHCLHGLGGKEPQLRKQWRTCQEQGCTTLPVLCMPYACLPACHHASTCWHAFYTTCLLHAPCLHLEVGGQWWWRDSGCLCCLPPSPFLTLFLFLKLVYNDYSIHYSLLFHLFLIQIK